MKTELLLLTLLYAIALSAFVGAINARGPARVALSYFLAILCLCAAVFHTSQYLALGAEARLPLPAGPADEPAALEPPSAKPEEEDMGMVLAPPTLPDTQELAASRDTVAAGESKNQLNQIRLSALQVLKNLASLNLGSVADVSDDEYEVLQNRAIAYLGDARKVKESLVAAAPRVPSSLTGAKDALSQAVENLVAAAYNAERFFKSENDGEERERLGNFRRGSQAASQSLAKVEGLLAPAAGGQ